MSFSINRRWMVFDVRTFVEVFWNYHRFRRQYRKILSEFLVTSLSLVEKVKYDFYIYKLWNNHKSREERLWIVTSKIKYHLQSLFDNRISWWKWIQTWHIQTSYYKYLFNTKNDVASLFIALVNVRHSWIPGTANGHSHKLVTKFRRDFRKCKIGHQTINKKWALCFLCITHK